MKEKEKGRNRNFAEIHSHVMLARYIRFLAGTAADIKVEEVKIRWVSAGREAETEVVS